MFERDTVFLALLLSALLLGREPARAQTLSTGLDHPHLAIGYVANAPNLMAGGGGYAIFDLLGGVGLYLDAKFDIETPAGLDTFEEGLTVQDAQELISGLKFIEREYSYQSFNAALVRPLNSELAVYVGGGVVRLTEFQLFQDPAVGSEFGRSGVFWVEDETQDEVRPNLMLGAFLRLSSFLSFQIGFETEPKGFTAGASFRRPRR